MEKILSKDLENLKPLLTETLEKGLDYLHDIDILPTSVKVETTDESSLPQSPRGGLAALAEFSQRFQHLMVASTGPRYWGFVTGGSTPAALAGDMLASIFDQNTQTKHGHGDVSALVELETINLLLDLFELPQDFIGGFVTGATMSNFSSLAVARQWLGKQLGYDVARTGIQDKFDVLSATPHSSAIKSLSMLGFGSANIKTVKTMSGTRESIDVKDLEKQIESLNGSPFILISSGGTVNTVDFDDLKSIARLREKHNFWWHIDAAFGGFAVLSPEHKHLLEGWEHADSITIDGHKWLNVPYESAFFFMKEKHKQLQIETFQNSNAPYLGDAAEEFNYLNLLPENSRRFKALAAWFTLKAYSREGYQEIVARNIHQAKQLGDFITTSAQLELLAPVRLNTVCFTLKGGDQKKVSDFLNLINDTGKVFMTPTFFDGKHGIRAALVNWRTQNKDIEIVKKVLEESLDKVLKLSF